MRLVLVVIPFAYGVSCPSSQFRFVYEEEPDLKVDVMVMDLGEPSKIKSHCSTFWPNDFPELTLVPSPPGCIVFDKTGEYLNHLPMKLPGGKTLHWIPENEASVGAIDTYPVRCNTLLSKTLTDTKLVVVGEGCTLNGPSDCPKAKEIRIARLCSIEEESTMLLQPTGWHRTLGSSLHFNHQAVAFQWLPRQFFAEPDELDRKAKASSVSLDINIENPSMVSPPQIVLVEQYPIQTHARVNPPSRDASHFTVWIPKAIWMTDKEAKSCAIPETTLNQHVKIPASMRFGFTEGLELIRTRMIKGDTYTSTTIPTGDPADLFVAVMTTAITAIAGALAIIIASTRK
jgi:hypothetical protein